MGLALPEHCGEPAVDPAEGPKKDETGAAGARLPYETPRILSREPLEVLAVSCSDVDAKPDTVSCPFGPSQS